MIAEKYIALAKLILQSNIVKKVYHSVELVSNDKEIKFPVCKNGERDVYVGPDDSGIFFAYIRQTGPAINAETKKEGSEKNSYLLQVPTRIVYFMDNEERNFDSLTTKLLNIAFAPGVTLIRYDNNAYTLAAQESPIGNFSFDEKTFYLAIDINLKFWINQSKCEIDNCIIHTNPIC